MSGHTAWSQIKATDAARRRARANTAAYRARHPERVREGWNRYYAEHRDEINARKRSRQAARHGLSDEGYDKLRADQVGLCAACGHEPTGKRGLLIDHDHACCPGPFSCGACVRGLVCDQCNIAIGMAGDDPVRLRQIAAYIDRARR